MPHNAKGDHYANPSYGRMMEGGKSKKAMSMEAYGEKAEQYMKAGYMINKLEIEYAENGFVVKCFWEEPYDKKKKNGEMGMMAGGYMEPTVKVFENVKDMTAFVDYAFNAYRHGGKEMKSSHGSHKGLSYPGENSGSSHGSHSSHGGSRTSVTSASRKKKGNPHY